MNSLKHSKSCSTRLEKHPYHIALLLGRPLRFVLHPQHDSGLMIVNPMEGDHPSVPFAASGTPCDTCVGNLLGNFR
jgi:hypothetical protein